MKKQTIRIISALLCLVMLIGALPFSTAAAEKRFTDVSVGSWYTEAAYYSVEKGYLAGTSATTFEPHTAMSRAMFVTMLASYAAADLSSYTGSVFTDVPAGKWYSAAVEWAYENGYVSGIGQGIFGPKNIITRQEIALLLYTYTAKANGEAPEALTSFTYRRYADREAISEWATDAVKWACNNGLFAAAGNEGDAPLFCPKTTATRAQVALIMMNFDKLGQPEPAYTMTIAGNSIENYTIVVSASAVEPVREAAELLQGWIADSFGVELDVVTDETEPAEYEIIIGKTNREDAGLISVDRTSDNDLSYVVNVQGSRLVIAGHTDADRRRGTLYGVYDFAEDALGYSFLMDNRIPVEAGDKHIAADYRLADGPGFESRCVYWETGWSRVYLNDDDYYKGNNWVHELGEWINGSGASDATPCLSDEANIQKVIDTVKKRLSRSPKSETIWVSQNDSTDYCKCTVCSDAYREDGARSATLVRLCNRVCEAIAEDHPNVKVLTLAYQYSVNPPKVTKPHKNVMIYYCTIQNCISCLYSDATCSLNKGIASNIETWGRLCEKIYVWDYSTNFKYNATAFPNFDVLRENAAWFYNNGVRGVFNNAITGTSGEFGELRAYLLSRLYRDPLMSEEEYNAHMNSFLEMYYGAGWQYVRQYIDLVEQLSHDQHWICNAPVSSVFKFDEVLTKVDLINSLWDAAEAYAQSQDILNNVKRSRLAATYLIQNATHESLYTNGTDATRAEYMRLNEEYYNEFKSFGCQWTENNGEINFSASQPPMKW